MFLLVVAHPGYLDRIQGAVKTVVIVVIVVKRSHNLPLACLSDDWKCLNLTLACTYFGTRLSRQHRSYKLLPTIGFSCNLI